jgi:hypothetical protein
MSQIGIEVKVPDARFSRVTVQDFLRFLVVVYRRGAA